jgi:nucleotide-binding universal stress UspA family protein
MIVAAVDFSEITDRVIEVTRELAAARGHEVLLLHVAAPDPDFVGWEAGPETVREQRAGTLRGEHGQLQERAAALREGGIEVRAALVEGVTVDTIVEEAERHDARWIVVGSHGKGALKRALLGSVSEGVARHAPCPVVVVPHGLTPRGRS